MKALSRTLLTGLATVLPLLATGYVLYWLGASAERALGALIRLVLPADWYWPGMGLAAGVGLLFAVGMLMHAWVVRWLFGWAEGMLFRLPLVGSVYGFLRDFVDFVSNSRDEEFKHVVKLRVEALDADVLGFVTRRDFEGLPERMAEGGRVAVYLPMSYQVGGYTLLVPAERLTPLDMPLEQAMRFILTAGINAGGDGRSQHD